MKYPPPPPLSGGVVEPVLFEYSRGTVKPLGKFGPLPLKFGKTLPEYVSPVSGGLSTGYGFAIQVPRRYGGLLPESPAASLQAIPRATGDRNQREAARRARLAAHSR